MKKTLLTTAAVLLGTTSAFAESYVTEGTVTAVNPVTRMVTIQEPYRECYPVEVPVYTENRGQNDWVNLVQLLDQLPVVYLEIKLANGVVTKLLLLAVLFLVE